MVQLNNHKTKQKKKDYKKVNIPESMLTKIKEIVNDNEDLGFTGADDFVRDAIRDSIIKYNQILKDKQIRKVR